ncbi:MAG: GAF domain-containing protein, partial [Planctomycetes bacterium]|nr:GAF domain-containing protein [Planctomycetota bacterium]
GMAGIYRLIRADVYEVLSFQTLSGAWQPAPDTPLPWSPESGQAGREELRSLQLLSDRLCRARTLEALYAELLASMASLFGASHALLMLHEEDCGKLIAIDSRGYDRVGAGAEVKLGEGLIGTGARTRKPLRVGGLAAVRRYARAVRESASRAGARLEVEIPLPGLADAQAQLALPLVAHDRLIGVLALESRDPLAFEDWHEAFLSLLANQAALAIAILSDREDEDGEARVEPLPAPLPARRRLFTWFAGDESVFVDGEYLIRNVPARILWKLLREHAQGRREF